MSLLLPAPVADAPLSRRNPAAKLLAAAVVMLGLLLSSDGLTPALVLAAELAALPLAGLGPRSLWRRGWPLAVGLLGVFLSNLLLARSDTGTRLASLGPLVVTGDELAVAATVAVRLAGVALPGLYFVATTDPVDLADSLVQQWRASPRFAYGALAAFRLLPLLGQEWRTIAAARRARGVDAGRDPVRALRLFGSQVFTLLVVAIRRGTRLATAMDARGFDAGVERSRAREQRVGRPDVLLVLAALALVAAAVAASVVTGHWRLAFS